MKRNIQMQWHYQQNSSIHFDGFQRGFSHLNSDGIQSFIVGNCV